MKAQISRFYGPKIADVNSIRSYGEFKQAWQMAENMGLKPYLIHDMHLRCKNPLQIFATNFNASGSVGAVEEFCKKFKATK